MDFGSIQPVLSGIVGATIATLIGSYLSRRFPQSYDSKSRESLLKEHRLAIRIANASFFVALCFGIALYPLGGYARNDWRPLLLGIGLGSVLSLLLLPLVSLLGGRSAREAYVAYGCSEGFPLWVTYGLLGAGVVAFVFALVNFYT